MEEIEDSYLLFYEQDVDNYQDDEGHTKPEEKGKINNKISIPQEKMLLKNSMFLNKL